MPKSRQKLPRVINGQQFLFFDERNLMQHIRSQIAKGNRIDRKLWHFEADIFHTAQYIDITHDPGPQTFSRFG